MIDFIKNKYKNPVVKLIVGAVAGGIIGYIYYTYFGCSNGSCAITSSPINTVLYFAFFGLVITYTNRKKVEEKEKTDDGSKD